MDGALVIVLVLAWALVLLPSALRSRRSSPQATVGGFEHAMAVLRNRPQGRELMVPHDAGRIVARDEAHEIGIVRTQRPATVAPAAGVRQDPLMAQRRRVLVRLSAGTVLTVLLALIVGGFLWTVAFLSVCALGGYVALLRRWKLQRDQAREVVRMLRTDQRLHEAEETAPVAHAVGEVPHAADGWGGLQVATAPDQAWESGTGVRIRRWDD